MTKFWKVPRMWEGETVAILAGGHSLTQAQVDYVKGKCKVIAINSSYLLAPWADLLYFCDDRWYTQCGHKDRKEFKEFNGIKVTLRNLSMPEDIMKLDHRGGTGLCLESDGLMTGSNSGYQCMGLAFHLGANRQLLLGYDMKIVNGKSHWHGGHKKDIEHSSGNRPDHVVLAYKTLEFTMLPKFLTIVEPLEKAGIEVINCTPDSALECFPKASLFDIL